MSFLNSPFYRILDFMSFIVILNVLWFAASLTVIGLLPATFALFILSKEMIINDDNGTVKPFFRAVITYFWRANALGLPMLIVLGSFIYYIVTFATSPGEWATFLFPLSFMAMFMYLIFLGHLVPWFAYARCSLKTYVQWAFWFSFYKPWYSFILFVCMAVVFLLTLMFPMLIFLGSASIFAYIAMSFFIKKMDVLSAKYPNVLENVQKEKVYPNNFSGMNEKT